MGQWDVDTYFLVPPISYCLQYFWDHEHIILKTLLSKCSLGPIKCIILVMEAEICTKGIRKTQLILWEHWFVLSHKLITFLWNNYRSQGRPSVKPQLKWDASIFNFEENEILKFMIMKLSLGAGTFYFPYFFYRLMPSSCIQHSHGDLGQHLLCS